jgi:uncharacterized membrane protein
MSDPPLAPWQRGLILGVQRFVYWLAKHWLALANLFMFFYVGLPVAAPVLMKAGQTGPANAIYAVAKPLCHELSFRSWFLFGEKPVYPRAEYVERFDLDDDNWPDLFLHAREFVGDETMGYKIAFCQRDMATYGALLLGGLAFGVLRRRGLRPMSFWLFVLLGVVPIGLDGGTQFLSLIIPGLPTRESVWQLRTLTGAMFGFSIAWLAYPYIHEGMEETRQLLAARYGWNGHAAPSTTPAQTRREQVVQLLKEEDSIK